ARLLPHTNVWSQVAASTRMFDQIRASTRALDQAIASTRVFEQAIASTRMFDQLGASTRVLEQAAWATSAWKPVSMVSSITQTAAAYQALDKLRIGAALMPNSAWISAAMPNWKAWSAAASIGAWRIPDWTVSAGFMPWAANSLVTFALPDVWRRGLYDVLRRIRER